jgi:hypothetical protein
VEVTHIPYKGAGPALTDLLGGRVDLLFDNLPGSLPSVRAGQVKPVAVTAKALAALAGRDQGIPRRRGSAAAADHEGGRDQAGVKPGQWGCDA